MQINIPTLFLLAIHLVWPFFFSSACLALEADELLVVTNRNAQGSIGVAKDYMEKRDVPKENLLRIFVTDAETCTREDYDKKIAKPIREKLEKYSFSKRPRCVVLVKGVPLRVGAVPLSKGEQTEIDGLNAKQKRLNDQLKTISIEAEKKQVKDALSAVGKKIKAFQWAHNTGASVDSELMLVLAKDYPLPMWAPNPFFWDLKTKKTRFRKTM